jgi:excisionase family DNA binding protein
MKFLTRKEVAQLLRVSERTVDRWLQRGDLGGYKLGNGRTTLWRIPKEELKKFLKKYKK